MLSFFKLIRYQNLFMVLLIMILTKYALIHSYIEVGVLTNFQFSLLALSILFITAGGYIVNDIFDVAADTINKPHKVFIDATISKKNAWISYFLLTLIGSLSGIYISFYFNKPQFYFIFIGTSIGLFLYAIYLKKIAFIGNILIAFFVVLSIVTIYLFETLGKESNIRFWKEMHVLFKSISVYLIMLYYVTFSFLTTLIREIIKDIEDINGDKKLNMKTIPILLGRRRSKNIVLFLSFLLLIFLVFTIKNALAYSKIFVYSILFILAPLLYFCYKIYNAETKKDYSFLSKLMKVIMFFGILSMFLFKFI